MDQIALADSLLRESFSTCWLQRSGDFEGPQSGALQLGSELESSLAGVTGGSGFTVGEWEELGTSIPGITVVIDF